MNPFVIAALNGTRRRGEHPSLAWTCEALARDAARSVDAGASALLVQVRDAQGKDTLEPAEVERWLVALRARAPGIPIGVRLEGDFAGDASAALAATRAWTELPDFASIDFGGPGAGALAGLLSSRGVRIEAGLSNGAAAAAAVVVGWHQRADRIAVEPREDLVEAALATVRLIERTLEGSRSTVPRLLHGAETTAWPLLEQAVRGGYGVRIGLADVLTLPSGEPARDNAELVGVALAIVREER